jgi:hypothetical protein
MVYTWDLYLQGFMVNYITVPKMVYTWTYTFRDLWLITSQFPISSNTSKHHSQTHKHTNIEMPTSLMSFTRDYMGVHDL